LTSETYESAFGYLVGLLGRGISPTQDLYLHTEQHNTEKRTHIHALSGIRTPGPSVRAVARPLGPASVYSMEIKILFWEFDGGLRDSMGTIQV
jgi:hypothetical protein